MCYYTSVIGWSSWHHDRVHPFGRLSKSHSDFHSYHYPPCTSILSNMLWTNLTIQLPDFTKNNKSQQEKVYQIIKSLSYHIITISYPPKLIIWNERIPLMQVPLMSLILLQGTSQWILLVSNQVSSPWLTFSKPCTTWSAMRWKYCWILLMLPVDVGSLPHYLHGFIHHTSQVVVGDFSHFSEVGLWCHIDIFLIFYQTCDD